MVHPWYLDHINMAIDSALTEDLGDGDHTTLATIAETAEGSAVLKIKDDGIIAGIELAKIIFNKIDSGLIIDFHRQDGDVVKKGDTGFTVSGSARSIVTVERLVLNCMQRMSGIATTTHQYMSVLKGLNTKLLDTRKTTPNFRPFEKWAVLIGGGTNHRYGLFDMILIKDNHIDYAGGIENAINGAKNYVSSNSKDLKIEVEARSIDDIERILRCGGVFRILIDNFSPEAMKEAVQLIDKCCETEASGGITLANLRHYAETGVDYISVGALTHSVKSLDLSLKAAI